ncbi:beta strand repeat-containing protein, partial [Haemophilus influenzae]
NITTEGTSTLNLTGKVESAAQQNPSAIVVESNLTLNALESSTINLHGSDALGATAIYVGKNVRNYAGEDYKNADNKRNLTLQGNNISITAAQNKSEPNAAKITITGDLTSDAKNVYLGEKNDPNGVNINLYGNTTFNSGNVTLNSKGENKNAEIKLNNLINKANLSVTGSKITFDGKTNSTNSMTVNATNDADNVILVNGDFSSTGNLDITAKGGMIAASGTAYQFDFKGDHTNITLGKDIQFRGKVNTKNTVNWTADKIKLGGDITQDGGHLTLTTKKQKIETDATNKEINGERTNEQNNTITFNGNDKSQLTIKTPALNGNYGKIKFKKYGASNLTLKATTDGGNVVLEGSNKDDSTKMGIEFEDSTLNVDAAKLNVTTTVTGNNLEIKKADGNANLDVEISNSGKLNSTGQTSVDATNLINNGTISGKSIALTATETVTNNATVTATEGNATLKGKTINQKGTVTAKQNATLEGNTITNSGTVTAETGKVGVTATENFTNTETGNLKGGNVEVTANQDVIIKGTVNGASVTLDGKNSLTMEQNTQVTATEGDATLAGKNISNSGTVTAEKGNVGVTATENFTNTETGNLKGGNVEVTANQDAIIKGTVSGTSVALDGKNSLTIEQNTQVTATTDATLKGKTIEQKGTVTAKQNATLEGNMITNSGTVTAETGKVGVTAKENFTNTETGNLKGNTGVTVETKDADIAGTVTAETGAANITATNDLSIKEGSKVSGGSVGLKAGENLNVAKNAQVEATEVDATLKGKNIKQNGTVTAKQNATLEGNTITNSGTVTAKTGKVGVTATEKFTNTETGNLKGNTGVAVETKDAEIAGTVTADTGDLTITAKNDAIIKGTLDAKTGAANITATNDLSIKEGSKVSGGSVGLKAGEN